MKLMRRNWAARVEVSGLIRKSIVLVLCAFCSITAWSQVNTYRIDDRGDYTVTQLETAMNAANFDSYRKPQSEVVLNFANGAKVSLLSGRDLMMRSIPVNTSRMLTENTSINPDRVFSIHSSGIIVESVQVKQGKK